MELGLETAGRMFGVPLTHVAERAGRLCESTGRSFLATLEAALELFSSPAAAAIVQA